MLCLNKLIDGLDELGNMAEKKVNDIIVFSSADLSSVNQNWSHLKADKTAKYLIKH